MNYWCCPLLLNLVNTKSSYQAEMQKQNDMLYRLSRLNLIKHHHHHHITFKSSFPLRISFFHDFSMELCIFRCAVNVQSVSMLGKHHMYTQSQLGKSCHNNNNNSNRTYWKAQIEIFYSAIRDFYNLLFAPRTVANTYAQFARARSCANHVQHIERLSRATCNTCTHLF